MGSDHDVYQEGSFRIPAIYLNDWPDRYIHTNGDTAANIDPTKLKRAAFIGAASGYFLAKMGATDVPEVISIVERASLTRSALLYGRRTTVPDEAPNMIRVENDYELAVLDSILTLAPVDEGSMKRTTFFGRARAGIMEQWVDTRDPSILILHHIAPGEDRLVYARKAGPNGPMAVFGYDYLTDHLASIKLPRPKLLEFQGRWGSGEEYAYETLNFVDGKRNVEQVRDAVSAEYGPVPIETVVEYLKSLESIGVLKRLPAQPPK
jgi:hypothetical protein